MKPASAVLIVDDNPTNLKLLRAVLESEGHAVVDAADGVEALSVLERETVGSVITDILMPRMDGYALCREIRRSERFRSLPLLVYTSTYSSPADEKMAYLAGADKYLIKPTPAPVLLGILAEFGANQKYAAPREAPVTEEALVMREYNAVLVRKLEEKNADLEKAQADLLRVNGQLQERTEELVRLNAELEERVRERTAGLKAANAELEAFSHSASHDLRAPLRSIQGFAGLLESEHAAKLDAAGREYLGKIKRSVEGMDGLIEDLLHLAQVRTTELRRRRVDLSELAGEIMREFQRAEPGRKVVFVAPPELPANCDQGLIRIALDNLLRNAWKFTKRQAPARIEVGMETQSNCAVYHVRDNGVGFDPVFSSRMFTDFQRFHPTSEFPGTGIGLSIVRRVIERHGGRIWAESVVDEGATFYFTLSR